jgi:hypothetical protein
MHNSLSLSLLTVGLLGVAAQAQSVTVPMAAAGTELPSSTSYFINPCLNASCCIRVQYFYAASEFINQGITNAITIGSLSFRANGGSIHPGGVTHPSLQILMSNAVAGAILAPNPTFANNHGANVTTVFGPGPVTTLATSGTSPNTYILVVPLSTPFVYDPNAGDLVIDYSVQGGSAGTLLNHDFSSTLGSVGARVWDFTPNATVQNPASGNNQPGMAIQVDLGYNTAPGTATWSPYGNACYTVAGSTHEFFGTAAAFDLANSSMSLVYGGTNYLAIPGISPYIAPTGAATILPLTDDSETTVTLAGPFTYPGGSTSSLVVCSNGFVSVATGNGVGYTPVEATWNTWPQASWTCWHDFNPGAAGSGAVKFEEVGTLSIVTFDGVYDFGGTLPNVFQWQFDRANGNVHFVWQTISLGGNAHLVGFKCGGTVLATPSIDISATLPANFTLGCDALPINLAASARPITGTVINLDTTRVPATASFSAVLVNFAAVIPGLELSPQMPNCYQNIALLGAVTLNLGFSPSWSQPFSIPNDPSYVGTNVFGQSAAFVPGANPLGVTTSNGLRLLVGNQ